MEAICADLPTFLNALNAALSMGVSVTAELLGDAEGMFTVTAPTQVTQWLIDYEHGLACQVSLENSVAS